MLKSVADAAGTGGYARELTAEERAAQQQELNGYIGGMDVVITTAQVPGRRPPVLVTADAVALMKPGSVIVDMAASALGGNVELSQPDQTIVTDNGVTIIAPTNLPATMPAGASSFYARNISALLLHLVKDGQLTLDMTDEITVATVISKDGAVVQPATAKLLGIEPEPGPEPASVAPAPLVEAPTVPPAQVVVRESEAEVMEKVVEEVDETPLAAEPEAAEPEAAEPRQPPPIAAPAAAEPEAAEPEAPLAEAAAAETPVADVAETPLTDVAETPLTDEPESPTTGGTA